MGLRTPNPSCMYGVYVYNLFYMYIYVYMYIILNVISHECEGFEQAQ